MLYFSKLMLNPACSEVQRDLHTPYEMHRTLLKAVERTRHAAGLLYRSEVNRRSGEITVIVQSIVQPDWTKIAPANYFQMIPKPKPIVVELKQDRLLHFRLRANPTVSHVVRDEHGVKRKNGWREPLFSAEKQCAWLLKKADDHGFKVKGYRISNEKQYRGKGRGKVLAVQYDGLLQITDADKFNTAWRNGIGPAKAFGCGLLSLAPA